MGRTPLPSNIQYPVLLQRKERFFEPGSTFIGTWNPQIDGHAGRVHRVRNRISWLPIPGPQQTGYRELLSAGAMVLATEPVQEQLGAGYRIGVGDIVQFQIPVRIYPDQLPGVDMLFD